MTLYHLPTLPKPEPFEYGKANETFPKGRPCMADGCITVLSIYNPGPAFCWQHEHLADEEDERPMLRLVEAA